MSAWRTGLLRSTMRYGFLMRAPNRTTGDLRWVVTETNEQHAVGTERIGVLPESCAARRRRRGRGRRVHLRSELEDEGFSRNADGLLITKGGRRPEVPAMTEESAPAMRGSPHRPPSC